MKPRGILKVEIEKLTDPNGQCGVPRAQKWAVMVDGGFVEAFRTKRSAKAYAEQCYEVPPAAGDRCPHGLYFYAEVESEGGTKVGELTIDCQDCWRRLQS